jgi:hypothetical protein
VRIAVPVQVDPQHDEDDGDQRDRSPDWNIKVYELRTISGGKHE